MKKIKKERKNAFEEKDNLVRLKVIGIGGCGGNAISRMCEEGGLRGIEFVAINTDVQDLNQCLVRRKIHIGKNLTRGLGTGMNPEIGRQAAEENRSEIAEFLKGADMVFITAGFGGGTGTGAAPIVAEAAREAGALTVAVITKPFTFEGAQRARIAEEGLSRIREAVDALIVIPNDRLFSIIDKETPILKSFKMVDEVLKNAVSGIADLITNAGIINVDFADVKAIMKETGQAIVGIGTASGKDRSLLAAGQAVNSPLLEYSLDGAKGVLFGVSGGRDLKMNEINEIAQIISEAADQSARIIFGAYHDRRLKDGQVKVTLIATGVNNGLTGKESVSLFGGLAPGSKSFTDLEEIDSESETGASPAESGKKAASKGKKKDEDVWDIPTFLRKRKR